MKTTVCVYYKNQSANQIGEYNRITTVEIEEFINTLTLGLRWYIDHKSLSTVVTKILHALKQVKQKCLSKPKIGSSECELL